MEYTLASAAVAAGINRSTVLRAIKSGKLSARRLDDKSFRIDASELARVYDLQQPAQGAREAMPGHAQGAQQPAQAAQDVLAAVELGTLRAKVELLERERETHQDTIADLRRRLDVEQEERRNLQRQLMPPAAPQMPQERPVASTALVEPSRRSSGFLSRLWGR